MQYKKIRKNILIAWTAVSALVIIMIAVAAACPALQSSVAKLLYVFAAGGIGVDIVVANLREKAEAAENPERVAPYRKICRIITNGYCILCIVWLLVLAWVDGRPNVHLPIGPMIGALVAVGVVAEGIILYLKHKEKQMHRS